MVSLELLGRFPELDGALPTQLDGRWWLRRDGQHVEVDAQFRTVEPVRLHPGVGDQIPLADGTSLDVVETDSGYAIVRSSGERYDVEVDDAAVEILLHPAGAGAVIDFPMGQDGTAIIAVDVSAGMMRCHELLASDEGVSASFHPDGTKLFVAPYPNDPELLRVLSWPDGAVLHTLEASALDLEQGFDLFGGYLGASRVAALATEQGIVVADADLTNATLFDLTEELGEGFVQQIVTLDDEHIAGSIWTPGGNETLLWRVS